MVYKTRSRMYINIVYVRSFNSLVICERSMCVYDRNIGILGLVGQIYK